MKSWWWWLGPLVVFQALVYPPADRLAADRPVGPCDNVPAEMRDECLRQVGPPVILPQRQQREIQELMQPSFRTGNEFSSSPTFTGVEEGSPMPGAGTLSH